VNHDLDDVMPGAYHPYYAGHDRVKLWDAAIRTGAVYVAVMPVLHASFTDTEKPTADAEVRTLMLTVRRIAAPIPYVGQRRYMLWPALVDEYGRGIGPVDPALVTDHEDFSDFLNALPVQPHATWCVRCGWWHLSTELLTRAGRRRLRQHLPYLRA
jgi:hypothetical protein